MSRAVPRRFPDPELLRRKKEELRHERAKSRSAPDHTPRFESSSATDLVVDTNFIGLRKSESGDFIPPDTQVAAGPSHLFEVVNVEGRIFEKDGTILLTFSLNTFFGLSNSTFLFDPKVRFDLLSGRWFVLAATDEDTFGTWRLAVSMSSDPTAGFSLYTFTTFGAVPDFPSLGINDDKVVLTANAFACTTICGDNFLGTMFVVLNKANLLAGVAPASNFFAPDQGLFAIQPAHSLSSTTTLFMAAVEWPSATSITVWSLTGVPGVGGGVTSDTDDLSIATLSSPPLAVQMGTSAPIETNDNRLLDAVFRDSFLWVTATAACTPSGDTMTRACLRFIQVLTGPMTVIQDFNFGTAGDYYYYPAIQTDSAIDLISVFSRSSASEFASVYAAGRLTTDTLNTLQDPVLIKAGEAPYGEDRWGDYSGAGIDPSDPASVWVAGEYARVEGGSEWGTWIARATLGAPGVTLSAIKAGNGTGTVTITPPGTTCDTTCAASFGRYTSSTVVTLGAVADADAIFDGWSGDPDCSDGEVTMDANKTCTATFLRLPDLTGQIILLTRTTRNGKDKLKFTLLVENAGTVPVPESFVVRLFLSDDAVLDGGDLLLTTKTVKGKKVGPGGVEIKGKATVPSPSQGKFILGVIDATGVIQELSEGNNTPSQAIP